MLSNLEAAIVQNPLVALVEATVLSAVEQMSNQSRQEINGDNGSSTCVVIISKELKVLGILTQQDVMRLVTQQRSIAKLTLRQFLKQHRSLSDSLIISQSDLRNLRNINAAIAYFESSQITHLAIVDAQDQLVGVLQHQSLKRLRDSIIHEATASLFAIQQKIHERIAKAEPLKDVLVDLLQTMETYLRGSSCSITLCMDDRRMGDVIAHSLPPDYARIVSEMGLPIAEGVGSCGTAAFRRELVVVTDIENDPLWQNDKAFVLCYGLQACSSMPIFASDRTLLGTFGIYYREQKAPQAQELDWIAQAAHIAGIAIERDRAIQALQQLNHELENRVQVRTQELQEREQFLQTVLDTFPLSVFWKDVNSVYLGCNQNFLDDAGLQTIAEIIGKTDYEMPWAETEADLYRDSDRAIIESQIPKLGIEDSQHQANGRTIWTEINKLPLRNLQGEVIGVLGTYQDISDRKNAEIALQASEAKFRRITESVPGMIYRYVLHPDGRDELVYVSPQVQQIFELTPEVVLQDMSCLWARFHPEDIPMIQSAIQESAASLQSFLVEGRLLLPNEQVKWIQVSSQPDRQENGDVIWDGVVIDISDRKVAEKALMLKQKHLKALINNIPHLAWIKDEQGRVIAVNEPFAQAFGVSSEELVGKTAHDIFPADLAQAYHDDDTQVLQSGQRKVVVEHGALADGTLGWFETTKTPFRDDQLNIAGTVGIAANITELKMMELSLKASERRYASLAAAAPVAIFRFDEPLNCVYVNERWSDLSGRPMESALGRGWMEGLHPEDSEQRIAEWAEYYAHANPESQVIHGSEGRHLRPDGTTTWVYIQVAKEFDDDGKVVGYIGTLTDITDRKNIELALQESQAQFRRMTESVPGMIFRYVLHPDGRDEAVYVSPQVHQIYELTPEEVCQDISCLWAKVHKDDAPMMKMAIESSADSLHPFLVEARILLLGERMKWVQISAQPDRQENGDVIWDGVVIDISDRKIAEKALMLKQKHLEALMNNIPQHAWIKDEQSRLIAVNEPLAQAFGVSAEELIGKTAFDVCPVDLAQVYHNGDAEVLQSGQRKVVVEHSKRADGTLGWFETTRTPFRDDQLNIAGTVGIAADITEQKQAEQKLQELSERLELAIQSAQIGVWEFDFSNNRLFWDERMLAIHGVSPEAFHGTYEDWSSRVHPDDLPHAQPDILEEQAIYNTEFRIIRPDGTVRWVMSYSCKQRNHQGELVRAVGVNIDISDRKNAELALQDLSDRLEFALKGANIGIWEYQMNEERLIWDERMFSLYGISPEEFSGKYTDWLQRVHPDDLDWVQQAEQKAHQGARECRVEFRIVRPDSTIRFIDSYAFKQYNAQGEILKTIGLNIDITDRKQAEAQLQHINEELIKATRLKDEFLANMSHELRTPLNAILGMTEILQEEIFGDLNDRQMQSLQTIEKSSNHLLELINDILDVAKIEAGQIHLSCQPSNVETLCQSSLVFIKQQSFSKNIQLESVIPANLPTINLDERRIRQVLINLLNNAVKFTPNGGKIILQVNYIEFLDNAEIVQSRACDTLEISIIDTGIGIAPDQIKRLFQPFVQVESALNRNYEGSGLGLVLVKRLVELHGGEVRLTSELGVGSCFTIAIPNSPFCELSVETEPALPSNSEAIKPEIEGAPVILLAEDNESNINLFADYLSLKGYRLVIAHNGQMAIDLAQQTHPDLILMDIQMPEMDGLEAIQRIRQIPELVDTPIIALTALAMAGDRDRCIAVGANDYLSKPVSLKQLVKKINDYLTD
ncbi:MAG: PAS domain S-box protein [Pseudanabaena sp.]|jgi:PAS domain S-box-containing protein